MLGATWTVEVDGLKHTIIVDCDAQSRASIRVDGRLAAKPIGAEEEEREVTIGSVRYVVRRLENNTFDLDIPPEVFLDRAAGRTPTPRRPGAKGRVKQESSSPHIKRWVGGVVVAIVVAGLIRYGARGFQYMRVPWQPYAAADGSFKAKFPDTPLEKNETENINGVFWTFRSRYALYKNHLYAVEYVDLKIVTVEANAQSLMNEFIGGWAAEIGGSIAMKEKTSLGRNPALKFEIFLPPGAGAGKEKMPMSTRMRGLLAVRGTRLFLCWTLTAASDPFAADLQQFMDGFEIPPPPPPVTFEAVFHEQPEEEQRPAPSAPPPTPPQAPLLVLTHTETMDPVRLARETEARRAAQPHVYLEAEIAMYHVAGCPALSGQMKRVSMEERPRGYLAHICVPENVKNWRPN